MNRLREFRKSRHMTQDELATETGVSQTRISVIEKYNDLPSKSHARCLAAYFGIKRNVLFPDGTQEYTPSGPNADVYLPPEEPMPVRLTRRFPPEFIVMCGHCRQRITMRADDRHKPIDFNPACPSCGAQFYDIVPLEEAVAP